MYPVNTLAGILTAGTPPPIAIWEAALAAQGAGSAPALGATMGDSTFASYDATAAGWTNVRQYCQANLIAALYSAAGYTVNTNSTFCDSNSAGGTSALAYDPRISMFTWAWAATGTANSVGGNVALNSSNANVFRLAADAFDKLDVLSITNPAYGSKTVNVGGVLAGTINLGVAASFLKTTLDNPNGLSSGNVDLLKTTAGDGKFITHIGLRAYNSLAPAVECWNWGVGSWTSADWAGASLTYSPLNAAVAMGAQMIWLNLDINDAQGAVPPATHRAHLETIYTALSPTTDFVINTGTPIGNAFAANMPGIVAETRAFASAHKLRLNDNFSRWGSTYANAIALGFMSVADQVHPILPGYQDVAAHNYLLSIP